MSMKEFRYFHNGSINNFNICDYKSNLKVFNYAQD